jgi:cyclophilin family peptidyl-prolyl cis-trans isomerase
MNVIFSLTNVKISLTNARFSLMNDFFEVLGNMYRNSNISNFYINFKCKILKRKIMKFKNLIWGFSLVWVLVACGNKSVKSQPLDNQAEVMVLIQTEFGDMKVKLYNDTPQHRDNFLKLVREGFYDDLLFHRVISDFMLQGGDPESKNANPNKPLGNGGPGYDLPAEIVSSKFHKKGALAAARLGDQMNPERKSSGSQFYVVKGKVYIDAELKQFADQQRFRAVRAEAMKQFQQHQATIQRWQTEGKSDSVNALVIKIQEDAEAAIAPELYKMSEERRSAYTTIGGTPHLDDAYTVFGEVVEGFNVIDSIATVKTGVADRPVNNVKMKIVEIK